MHKISWYHLQKLFFPFLFKVSVPTFVNYSKIIKDVQRAADSNLNDNVFGLVLSLCSIMNLNQSRGNTTTNSKVLCLVLLILLCICHRRVDNYD